MARGSACRASGRTSSQTYTTRFHTICRSRRPAHSRSAPDHSTRAETPICVKPTKATVSPQNTAIVEIRFPAPTHWETIDTTT